MADPLVGELITAGSSSVAEYEAIRRWMEATELWLNSRNSDETRRAYRFALGDLLGFTGRLPGDITRADLQRWGDEMRRRQLAKTTVRLRVAAVSSFYQFCVDELQLLDSNPAGGRSLRPAVEAYGKGAYLSPAECRALLGAIPQDSPQGLRDLALITCYLYTGRRNSEMRRLRWGDLTERGGVVWYRWEGKRGKGRTDVLPDPAYRLVVRSLVGSERWPAADGDYIFPPLNDCAVNLPTVAAETWERNRPLSVAMINKRLRMYALRAGLRAERLHVHSLRHTAAMLRREAGDDVDEVSAFLNHSSLAVTNIYLHRMEGRVDESWQRVEELIGGSYA